MAEFLSNNPWIIAAVFLPFLIILTAVRFIRKAVVKAMRSAVDKWAADMPIRALRKSAVAPPFYPPVEG